MFRNCGAKVRKKTDMTMEKDDFLYMINILRAKC